MAATAPTEDLLARAREARQRGEVLVALEDLDRLVAAQPTNVDAIFERAIVRQELARLEDARAGFLEVITAVPNHVPALMRLGQLARAGGNREESLGYFRRAALANPEHVEANMQAAYDLRELGRREEAEKSFARALELAPSHYGALAALGYLARARGDRAQSRTLFERAAAEKPAEPEGHLQLGYDLRELGELDQARSAFLRVIELSPDNAGALIALGYLARRAGDRAQSLAYFGRAAEAHPDHVDSNLQIAYDLRELGQLEAASKQFERVLELSPGHEGAAAALTSIERQRSEQAKLESASNPENPSQQPVSERTAGLNSRDEAEAAMRARVAAYLREGHQLQELGKRAEAQRIFAHVLALVPNQIDALMRLGYLARAGSDRIRALAYFQQAVAASPRHVDAIMEVGYEWRELGRQAEAEKAFSRALEIAPNHGPALMALGYLARTTGDWARSLHFFELAAANEPGHIEAKLQIAYDLRALEREAEAESMFELVAKLAPGHAGALLALADYARKRGDREKCLGNLEAAANANANDVPVQLTFAAELEDQGRIGRARDLITKVAAAHPENGQLSIDLGRLERRCGNHAAALDAFRSVLGKDPKNVPALVECAREEAALGQARESEHTIAQALALEPNNVEALLHAAEQARLAEKLPECIAICERLFVADPKNLRGYLLAAEAAAELAQTDRALILLDRAERNVGPKADITLRRFDLLVQAGDFEAARAIARAAPDEVKQNMRLWSRQLQLVISLGEFDAAAQLLNDPPTGLGSHEQARVILARGQFAEAQWQLERAAALYREALALNANDDLAHLLLARASLLTLDLGAARAHVDQWIGLSRKSRIAQEDPFKPSHSQLRRLVDEFNIDAALLEQLKVVGAELPVVRIRLLRQLLRRDGSHLAPAVSLLLALRESGLLARMAIESAPSPMATRAIPKRIAQFCDRMEAPADLLPLIQSWRRHHPDYEFMLFNDKSARAFLAEHFASDVLQAYMRAHHPAQKADLFRLAFLVAKGGFYVDVHDRCLASLEGVVPAAARFVAYQEDFATLGNDLLGALPNQPVIRRALDLGKIALNRGTSDSMWLSTGPGLLTRAFACELAETGDQDTWLEQNVVLDRWQYHRAAARISSR